MVGYGVREPLEPYLKTKDLLLLRVLAPPMLYAPISFSYSMISLCFKVPFTAKCVISRGTASSKLMFTLTLQIWPCRWIFRLLAIRLYDYDLTWALH